MAETMPLKRVRFFNRTTKPTQTNKKEKRKEKGV